MNASSDNTSNAKAFTDAIKRMAAAECRKIDAETSEIEKQRLDLLEGDAKSRYQSYIDYEVTRVKADTNRRISSLEENARKQLTEKRTELSQKVFKAVENKLMEFHKTNEYKSLLISSAKEIEMSFPDSELEFFVSTDDLKYAQDIKSVLSRKAEISADKDIVFGGIKALEKTTSCLADNTLDTKLKKQKQLFLSTSGLKI